MAEDRVEIIIEAVDKVSGNLNKIQGSLTNTTNSLIAIGIAAGSVDNIFSSLTSISLRLENAHERVANAEDRLVDSQKKLIRLQQSGKATAEQLEDAQTDLERATRGLNISQNNLARTQNQVIGTYISVGVQVLTLIKTLPELRKTIEGVTAASRAFIATPLGAVLLAIGAALAIGTGMYKKAKEASEEFGKASKDLKDIQSKLADEIGRVNRATQIALEKTFGIFEQETEKELRLKADIAMFDEEIARARLRYDDKEIESLEYARGIREDQLAVEQKSRESILAEAKVQEKIANQYQTLASDNVLSMPYLEKIEYLQGEYLKNFYDAQIAETLILINESNKRIDQMRREEQARGGVIGTTTIPGLSRNKTRQPTATENIAQMSFASSSDLNFARGLKSIFGTKTSII